MEAIILSRIHDLLTYRRWFRTHRWADWPQERRDYDVELRALVKLARAARKAERDPYPPTMTYAAWTSGELAEAFGK